MSNKSDENWEVGKHCLGKGDLNVATSRLYYGLFHAVLLYAKTKKSYVWKGYGVHRDMINIVYSTGKANKKYGKVFKDFFTLRITADYEDETPSLDDINELLSECETIRNHYLKIACA